MAYFHCLIGGGSSGGGYTLTVTCDAAFAGTTITCTDGTTTLTQTCPSASPYEVTFDIPNGGDWTISGTTGGHTVSTGVSIPTSASLIATIQQTVTIYSAKEDTVTYTDIYGDTQTEVFASGQTSKQITVDINPNGSSITFTSGVAKDPSNLSNNYSKTVTVTSATTEIYLMPANALYWFGYLDLNICTNISTWTFTGYTYIAPTYATNYADFNAGATQMSGLASVNQIASGKTAKAILEGVTAVDNAYGNILASVNKNVGNTIFNNPKTTSSIETVSGAVSSAAYISAMTVKGRRCKCYALWYE